MPKITISDLAMVMFLSQTCNLVYYSDSFVMQIFCLIFVRIYTQIFYYYWHTYKVFSATVFGFLNIMLPATRNFALHIWQMIVKYNF